MVYGCHFTKLICWLIKNIYPSLRSDQESLEGLGILIFTNYTDFI
jgi:hypothetical protein